MCRAGLLLALLAQGFCWPLEGKPNLLVLPVRVRRERQVRREVAVQGCPELSVAPEAPVWLLLSCAGAGLGRHAGDVKEQ